MQHSTGDKRALEHEPVVPTHIQLEYAHNSADASPRPTKKQRIDCENKNSSQSDGMDLRTPAISLKASSEEQKPADKVTNRLDCKIMNTANVPAQGSNQRPANHTGIEAPLVLQKNSADTHQSSNSSPAYPDLYGPIELDDSVYDPSNPPDPAIKKKIDMELSMVLKIYFYKLPHGLVPSEFFDDIAAVIMSAGGRKHPNKALEMQLWTFELLPNTSEPSPYLPLTKETSARELVIQLLIMLQSFHAELVGEAFEVLKTLIHKLPTSTDGGLHALVQHFISRYWSMIRYKESTPPEGFFLFACHYLIHLTLQKHMGEEVISKDMHEGIEKHIERSGQMPALILNYFSSTDKRKSIEVFKEAPAVEVAPGKLLGEGSFAASTPFGNWAVEINESQRVVLLFNRSRVGKGKGRQ